MGTVIQGVCERCHKTQIINESGYCDPCQDIRQVDIKLRYRLYGWGRNPNMSTSPSKTNALIRLAFQKLDEKLEKLDIKEEEDLQTVMRLARDIAGQVKVKIELTKQKG